MGATQSTPASSRSLQTRLDRALEGRRRPADERFSIRFKEPFGDYDLLRSTSCQGLAHPVHVVIEARNTANQHKPPRFLDRVCYPDPDFLTVQECLEMQNKEEPKHIARVMGSSANDSRTAVYYAHNNLGSVASLLRRCRAPGATPVSVPTAIAIRLVRQVLLAIQALHPADDKTDAFEHGQIGLESILGHVDKDGNVDFCLSGLDGARRIHGDANLAARLAAAAADKSRLVIVVQELIALSHSDPRHLPDLQALKAVEADLTALLTPDPGAGVARDLRWLADRLRGCEEAHVRSAGQRRDLALFSDACRALVWEQARAGGDNLFWRTRGEVQAWAGANLGRGDEWAVVWWSREAVDPVHGVEIPRR
ncbi:hypothetical protein MGG_14881 [Pyricularia oryzae 70-15]|uniref:Protein kinase domain-containing protein n=3 Tax=Pyricularia oryzae TaxID=318829 RepID=G4N8U5_PYRO7|nr:uncharacterized protein MGG_14881 [Pyricularia oryzae 70-15]EHA50239.1 hypothetical protein MGG_14881 [Pyricularia oryzae 70-15]ELQ35067.1 hypothetical protein OOU_Y34scaffold00726g26 [Pyricularia oryzae Y34]KAI7915315.1 hypothetical protein M9X92_008485 [Pyricularia oryzae]KAI7921767.1 hypothetical protein M0657_005959 [Pyricularia oryzae]